MSSHNSLSRLLIMGLNHVCIFCQLDNSLGHSLSEFIRVLAGNLRVVLDLISDKLFNL